MVRYDFGTIIDEVPKNLHFVRILGAEDVFDSHLLQFVWGRETLILSGFPPLLFIVTDGTFGSFIAESVFLLAGYILSNQSDYTLIHNTGVSEYQYPDVVSCYPCNFLIVFSAFLCERITD